MLKEKPVSGVQTSEYKKSSGYASTQSSSNAGSGLASYAPKTTKTNTASGSSTAPAQKTSFIYPDAKKTITPASVLASIMTVTTGDKERGESAYGYYKNLVLASDSPIWKCYDSPTSTAIGLAQESGLDVSGGINDDWFAKNAGLKNYYTYSDTSNGVVSPGTKASTEQKQAYAYYQVYKDYETTKTAQQELEALNKEVAWWTNHSANYSDEEIKGKIDWSKYPTLTKMDDGRKAGVPIGLTSAVSYNQDTVDGMIWAARNGDGKYDTSDNDTNAVRYYLQQGNGYVADETIAAKLAPGTATYAPYSVGSTMTETNLKYGVYGVDKEWFDKNVSNVGNGVDESDYGKYYTAEQTTVAAEAELVSIQERLDRYVANGGTDAESFIKSMWEDCPTLNKLQAGMDKMNLVDTTRAIDFTSKAQMEEDIRKMFSGFNSANGTAGVVESVGGDKGSVVLPTDEQNAIANHNLILMQNAGVEWYKSPAVRGSSADGAAAVANGITNGTGNEQTSFVGTLTSANNYANAHLWGDLDAITAYDKANESLEEARKYQGQLTQMTSGVLAATGFKTLSELQQAYITSRDEVFSLEQEMAKPEYLVEEAEREEAGQYKAFLEEVQPIWEKYGVTNWADWSEAESNATEQDSDAVIAASVGYGFETFESNEKGAEYLAKYSDAEPSALSKLEAQRQEAQTRSSMLDAAIAMYLPEGCDVGWLMGEIKDTADAITEREATLETATANRDKAQEDIAIMETMYGDVAALTQGGYVDSTGMHGVYGDIQVIYSTGANYEPTWHNNASIGDLYMAEGHTLEETVGIAKEGIANIDETISVIRTSIDNVEQSGGEVPAEYLKNCERAIAALERQKTDFNYFILRSNEDFEEEAAKMEYSEDSMAKYDGIESGPYGTSPWVVYVDPETYEDENVGSNMTEEERKTYAYLYVTQGRDAAIEYYNWMADDTYGILTTRQAEEDRKRAAEVGESLPILSSVASVIVKPAAAILGFGYTAVQSLVGGEINPDSMWYRSSDMVAGVRDGAGEKVYDTLGGGFTGTLGKWFYNTAMSAADSTYNAMLMSGITGKVTSSVLGKFAEGSKVGEFVSSMVGGAVGAFPMALDAFQSAVDNAIKNGLSQEDALKAGVGEFLGEWLSEIVTVENIGDLVKSGASAEELTMTIGSILKNGIEEGFGEAAGDIINQAWSELVNVETLQSEVDALIADDPTMTKDKAWSLVIAQHGKQLAESFAAGFVSAGMSGSVSYVSGKMVYKSAEKHYDRFLADQKKAQGAMYQDANLPNGIVRVAVSQEMYDQITNMSEYDPRERLGVELYVNDNSADTKAEQETAQAIQQEEESTEPKSEQSLTDNGEKLTTRPERESATVVQNETESKAETKSQPLTDNGEKLTTRPEQETATVVQTDTGVETETSNRPLTDNGEKLTTRPEGNEQATSTPEGFKARAITAMYEGMNGDAQTAANAYAGVLTADSQSTYSQQQGRMAAEGLISALGNTRAAMAIRNLLNATGWNIGENIRTAFMVATTPGAKSNDLLDSIATTKTTLENVQTFFNAVKEDLADADVMNLVRDAYQNWKVKQEEQKILDSGVLVEKAGPAEQSVETEATNLQQAQQNVEDKYKQLEDYKQAVVNAYAAFQQNVGDSTLKATLDHAIATLEGLAKEMENNDPDMVLQRAQETYNKAKGALERIVTTTLNEVHRQAQQNVAEQDAQVQSETMAAEQQKAEADAVAEVAAQQKAEAEITTAEESNTTATEADAFIKENGYENASESDRQKIAAMYYDMKQGKAQESAATQNQADASLARAKTLANALQRKGIARFRFEDMNIRESGYYDRSTGEIVLNKNATQGDVIRQTISHELTHKAEQSGYYGELSDLLIRMEYGEEGTNSSKYKADLAAKTSLYNEYFNGEYKGDIEAELVAGLSEKYLSNEEFFNRLAGNRTLAQRVAEWFADILNKFKGVKNPALDNIRNAQKLLEKALKDADEHEMKPESGSIAYSIKQSEKLAGKTMKYFSAHQEQSNIGQDFLDEANRIVAEMADYMRPYLDAMNNKGRRYLPEEILGKTTFGDSSYGGKSVENTTICFRTLAYIDFVNEVKEGVGRPLSVEESFLASQMIHDIAKDPQCMYCYVSLDRKAYDGFLLEYMKQRDDVVDKYRNMENKNAENIKALYKEFLNKRKNTKPMRERFNLWIETVNNGGDFISLNDLTTEEKRSAIVDNGGALAEQMIDAERYAQSASWAKKLEQYRSYNGDLLNMKEDTVKALNEHYGLRFYSFSEYTPAFIVENMQQIRDASVKGLYGLAYTKKPDFAMVFAKTGMNINISVFGRMDNGQVVPDTLQGANWDEVKTLRNQYKNVGAVFVATNDAMVEWALSQDWIDVVIPFHIVRTGANIAEFYKWVNHTKDQADVDKKGKNKTITPAEFHNNRETYFALIKERGLTPRFQQWTENPNYMKLVNETRLSDLESSKLTPDFDLEAAKASFDQFVKEGGYYGDWYEEGADFGAAVRQVVDDIKAGKKANEVTYGRQDYDASVAMEARKARIHGNGAVTKKFRITPEQDAEYMAAVQSGDKNSQQNMVVEAAKNTGNFYTDAEGNPKKLYHGTKRFGWTVFDTEKTAYNVGGIFLTDNKSVARGYSDFGKDRGASSKYVFDDGTDATLIKNAENVLNEKYRKATTDDVSSEYDRIMDIIREQKDRIVESYDEMYSPPEEIVNDFWSLMNAFEAAVDNDSDRYGEGIGDYIKSGDTESAIGVAERETIIGEYSRSLTDSLDKIKEYYKNNEQAYNDLEQNAPKTFALLFKGYDFGDAVIDMEYAYKPLFRSDLFVSESGKVVSRDQVQSSIEYDANKGNYTFYGEIGDSPLEIDAGGSFWTNIKAPMIGDGTYSTDSIVKWAKKNGYSSVVIKNVMDPGVVNAYGDDYIFFSSSQIKSADPVTYDDNGNVVPLSERFNSADDDIRYRITDEGNTDVTIPNDDLLRQQMENWYNNVNMGRIGERQFANKTAPNNQNTPQYILDALQTPDERFYDVDTNADEVNRNYGEMFTGDKKSRNYEARMAADELIKKAATGMWDKDDNAKANILMAMGFRGELSPDITMGVSLTYNKQGTKIGQAFQARKIFNRMTPTGAKIYAAGHAEQATEEWMNSHEGAARKANNDAKRITDGIQQEARTNSPKNEEAWWSQRNEEASKNNKWNVNLNNAQQYLIEYFHLENVNRPGLYYNRATIKQRMLEAILNTKDPFVQTGLGMNLVSRLAAMRSGAPVLTEYDIEYIGDRMAESVDIGDDTSYEGRAALGRAYEAYGNIYPASFSDKLRTYRYMNMLLNIPSAIRNVIGNAMQNVTNDVSHGIAAGIDAVFNSKGRTIAGLSAKQRKESWLAFAEETKRGWRDIFEKVDTSASKDMYDINRRSARTFQNNIMETAKTIEVALMSICDRNFWARAYSDSIAEQQNLAEMRGEEFVLTGEVEARAKADANYATFTEDNFVVDALAKLKRDAMEQFPALGLAIDFLMPFTGVPTNIAKRFVEYSPLNLAYSVVKGVAQKATGKTIDKRSVLMNVAKGLTGTGKMIVGYALASMGMLQPGTEDDDDKKMRDIDTAQGLPYSWSIRVGDTNISLSTFLPWAAPLVYGGALYESIKNDEDLVQIMMSTTSEIIGSAFDQSFMSSIQDLFNTDIADDWTERIVKSVVKSGLSQMIPLTSIVSEVAAACDPYVRDTKDKDFLTEQLKTIYNKIPGLRETLPKKVNVAGEEVEAQKRGVWNLIDPFTHNKVVETDAYNLLNEIYDATGKTAGFPADNLRNATNTMNLSLDGESRNLVFNDEEKQAYKERYGSLWLNGGYTYNNKGSLVEVTGVNRYIKENAYKINEARRTGDWSTVTADLGKIVSAAKVGAAYEFYNGELMKNK